MNRFMNINIFHTILIIFLLCNPLIHSLKIHVDEHEITHTHFRYEYHFNTPTITKIPFASSMMTRIQIEHLSFSNEYGKPRLPEKHLKLLLPYATTITNITVIPKGSQNIKDHILDAIEIGTGGRSFTGNTVIGNRTIPLLFNEDEYFPQIIYENLGIQYHHGYPILHLILHPVQYHRENKQIRYINEIELVIETETSENNDTIIKPAMKNIIVNEIDNPDIMETYPHVTSSFYTKPPLTYDYIVITRENLSIPSENESYSFQDLLDFRTSQGLHCMIKTLEEIQSEYNRIDIGEKIRNFIKYAYEKWDTQWILLGGDVEIVPVRYLYDIDGQEADENKIASDIYYQCLDGTYNYDNDDKWGEEYDGVDGQRVDLLAEIYIGRAPVDNEEDVSNFVEKTLWYEQSDWNTNSYLRNVLSAGQRVWDGPGGYGAGYLERTIDFCSDYDMDTYGIPSDYFNIIELYERDIDWIDDDVIDIIDDGVSIINHVGHGSALAAMKLTIYELEELNNTGKYGLFYSAACHSGQLEKLDDCLAEQWVTLPKKGGFASIMNTGYGYGSVSDYDGADNRYAREFFDALFSPDEKITRIGVANQDSKEDNIWHIHDNNMFHCYYNTMLFGDPYISIKGAEEASADFTWDKPYPKTGEIIQFTDQSEGMITYHTWDFGDGQVVHGENPVHVFSQEKTYDVTLTVMDNHGYRSTITYTIDVRNQWDPIAIISPSNINVMNPTVYFSANKSWDPDGYIENYHWDFGDGETSDLMEPVHTYITDGTYEVSLFIEDNNGNVAKTYSTIVLLQQYPPNKPVITAPSSTFSGEEINISMVTEDPEEDTVQYGILWSDNEDIQWTNWYASGEECIIQHQWMHAGVQTVQVQARDIHFGTSNWSDPFVIIVKDESDPIIELEQPVNGIYMNNRRVFPFFTSLVFGSIDIIVNASDTSGIEHVVFYIDDMQNPVGEVLTRPYRFSWNERSFQQHMIKVVAKDTAGKKSSIEHIIWKFF